MFRPAAALLALFAPRRLDENPPHRLGGCSEKVRAIREYPIPEAQPGLMHQRRRLQRVIGPFATQVSS
jgi:hypothetical protein